MRRRYLGHDRDDREYRRERARRGGALPMTGTEHPRQPTAATDDTGITHDATYRAWREVQGGGD